MAKTLASHVGDRILHNPSGKYVHWEWGKLADAYSPGTTVYESATGTWTVRTASAGHLTRMGVIMDKAELDLTTWARRTIDDAYTANDMAPICTSGIVTVACADQGGAKVRGHKLIQATNILTVATSGTAIWEAILAEAIADDDVFCKAGIGVYAILGALLGGA